MENLRERYDAVLGDGEETPLGSLELLHYGHRAVEKFIARRSKCLRAFVSGLGVELHLYVLLRIGCVFSVAELVLFVFDLRPAQLVDGSLLERLLILVKFGLLLLRVKLAVLSVSGILVQLHLYVLHARQHHRRILINLRAIEYQQLLDGNILLGPDSWHN